MIDHIKSPVRVGFLFKKYLWSETEIHRSNVTAAQISVHHSLPPAVCMRDSPEGGPAMYTLTQFTPLSVEKAGVAPDVTLR